MRACGTGSVEVRHQMGSGAAGASEDSRLNAVRRECQEAAH